MIPASRSAALQHIYEIYGEWVTSRFSFACGKGCSSCCTRSVTMTILEGQTILAFLEGQKGCGPPEVRNRIGALIAEANPQPPVMTTNRFAEYCLSQQEPPQETPTPWDMRPCPLLDNDCCSVYPVRPFGCRSFGSQEDCRLSNEAVAPALMISANTACLQLIEHLDFQNGQGGWGYLADVLRTLAGLDDGALLPSRPLPGFLLAPQEEKELRPLLTRIYTTINGEGPHTAGERR